MRREILAIRKQKSKMQTQSHLSRRLAEVVEEEEREKRIECVNMMRGGSAHVVKALIKRNYGSFREMSRGVLGSGRGSFNMRREGSGQKGAGLDYSPDNFEIYKDEHGQTDIFYGQQTDTFLQIYKDKEKEKAEIERVRMSLANTPSKIQGLHSKSPYHTKYENPSHLVKFIKKENKKKTIKENRENDENSKNENSKYESPSLLVEYDKKKIIFDSNENQKHGNSIYETPSHDKKKVTIANNENFKYETPLVSVKKDKKVTMEDHGNFKYETPSLLVKYDKKKVPLETSINKENKENIRSSENIRGGQEIVKFEIKTKPSSKKRKSGIAVFGKNFDFSGE